jgi:hypothetical protein
MASGCGSSGLDPGDGLRAADIAAILPGSVEGVTSAAVVEAWGS